MSADSANTDGARRPIAFISHHSSQVDTARQLKQVLALNGVDGWMAPDDIDPGRPFDQAIIEQVRRSDLIILLFCARSDQSRHVKRELMMAENGDKLIFPVRLENIDADGLAYWLNDYQWIDWFDRRDDTIQRMIDTIKRLVEMDRASEAPPAEETESSAVVPPVAEPPPPPPPPEAPPETPSGVAAPEEPPAEEPPADEAEEDPAETDEAAAEEPVEARSEEAPAPLNVPPNETPPVETPPADIPTGDDGDDGSGRNKLLLFGLLGLGLVAVVLAAIFLWPSGESEETIEAGVLSPSVDCADLSIPSHAQICADSELRARETALSQHYQAALETLEGADRVALQQGHAAFLARRDECRTTACISTVYDAREGELAEYEIPEEAIAEQEATEETVPEAEQTVPDTSDTPDRPAVPDRPRDEPQTPQPTPATMPERRPPPEPDPPRQSQTTAPRPANNPASWVRNSDYPSNILRNGEQGTSRYQVRVGANGLPTACFTIGSSGHFQLDARACNMVMNRARFEPARDASGRAVAGLYTGSHRWRAPR